mmetsp:Transcript_13306/g.32361  ORF Transcript_13306/g.32361 Transcript_13306/m.32361 type:complete len:274 (+) Transcript_13306:1464-2285(+)
MSRGALERHARHLLAKVLEPRLDVLLGREVDLVEQEDHAFFGVHPAHELLHLGRAARQGVTRVQDLNDDVGDLHHLDELLVVGASAAVVVVGGTCIVRGGMRIQLGGFLEVECLQPCIRFPAQVRHGGRGQARLHRLARAFAVVDAPLALFLRLGLLHRLLLLHLEVDLLHELVFVRPLVRDPWVLGRLGLNPQPLLSGLLAPLLLVVVLDLLDELVLLFQRRALRLGAGGLLHHLGVRGGGSGEKRGRRRRSLWERAESSVVAAAACSCAAA